MSEELKIYKCPNCDGIIEFDPNAQKLVCPSCGTEIDVESLEAFNQIDSQAAQDHFDWDQLNFEYLDNEGMRSYVCEACGGEIIGDASMASSSCPYCGNHVIVEKQFEGLLKPNYILPFKQDKDAAIQAMHQHFKGKVLLPNDFLKTLKVDKVQGLYVPYWLFDCDADGQFRYRAKRTRSYRSGDYIITNTDHYLLYREGNMSFKHIPVDGSTKIGPEVLEAIEPFDFKELKDFKSAYLQGYLSDRFDSDASEAKPRANERIRNSMFQEISATTAGYSTVMPERSNINIYGGKIAYAMLPVWMINTKYKGKDYHFAMNAQTGKFVGDLPISWKKFIMIIVLVFLVVAIVVGILVYRAAIGQ